MMKRCLISLLIVVGAVVLAAWEWQTPRRVVRSELHPLYLRYEHNPDVAAGFVKGLRIADSVTIGVVTLRAKDTTTWYEMLENLKVSDVQIDIMRKNKRSVTFTDIPKNNDNLKAGQGAMDMFNLAVCTPDDMTVSIYDVQDSIQEDILFTIQIRRLSKNE